MSFKDWSVAVKNWSIPPALQFLIDLARQFRDNQGVLNAAALTYTTLFAVVPLLTVSYAMLSAIPTFQGVGDTMQQWVFNNFVPATGEVVYDYMRDFTTHARALTSIGVVFLVVTSIMMMKNIEAAFNRIWRVTEPRKGVSSFLLYWAVLSLGPLLLGLGILLTSYITALPFYTSATEVVGRGRVLSVVPMLLSAVAFTLLYAAVPNCRVPVLNALIGGVLAAISFELAKRGFAFFVTQFPSYQLIYGAFAAVPLFLAWIFICWVIILLGAELTRYLTIYHKASNEKREPHLYTVLSVLYQLWQAQQRGVPLQDSTLLKRTESLDQGRWDRYVQLLTEGGVIRRTEEGSYLLSRDLSSFTIDQLQTLLPWPLPDQMASPAPGWCTEVSERLSRVRDTRTNMLDLPLQKLFSCESEPDHLSDHSELDESAQEKSKQVDTEQEETEQEESMLKEAEQADSASIKTGFAKQDDPLKTE